MSETSPRVRVVEVGPRDGLQNESTIVPTESKIAFIEALAAARLPEIELTSFVRPDRIPQLADAEEVAQHFSGRTSPAFTVLVPNERGLERALAAGVKRIAVFTAASESFNRRNIGMSIDESLHRYEGIVKQALASGMTVRGYVSTAFVCPFEGAIPPAKVTPIAAALIRMGVDEVSLGDTIGKATPASVDSALCVWLEELPLERLALHFHDTSGTALGNVAVAVAAGIRTFDASAGGLGGCPYAPGAPGNVATESLLRVLHGWGYETGIDPVALFAATEIVRAALGGPSISEEGTG
jgi:hydroxymethylglutaryl-CoA lyase